jgi:hypothetical protein
MIETIAHHAPVSEQARPHAPRRHDAWCAGDKAHQGDLILVALKKLPKSAKPRKDRQMADGTTKGSQHIVIGGSVYDCDRSELAKALNSDAKMNVVEKYIGPVFAGECVLTHPQHQHQSFPDHACTVVVYQRNLDAEEREQQVCD